MTGHTVTVVSVDNCRQHVVCAADRIITCRPFHTARNHSTTGNHSPYHGTSGLWRNTCCARPSPLAILASFAFHASCLSQCLYRTESLTKVRSMVTTLHVALADLSTVTTHLLSSHCIHVVTVPIR